MVPAVLRLQISGLRVIALVAALVVGLSACSSSAPPEVPEGADGTPDPVLVVGRDVYAKECSNCHAADGGGKRGPRLSGGSVVDRYPEVADQIAVVTDGRAAMPAFGSRLTDEEIEAVVLYTREVL